ncbi:MAG: hypothetical protein JXB15_02950 [Anaerolineales bacterium]|nr:hypothetical protein [Anaerolineales bacterium]
MKKCQVLMQVVGMITVGLLAVYGLLALLGRGGLVVASASKAFDPEAPSVLAPPVINYQGTLRNIDGSLINDAFTMTFRLYDDPVGGNLLHSETIENVMVRDSLFTVLLGDTTSIDPEIFKGAVYVGVQVENDSEMVPRQRLAPVGFAVQLTDGVFVDRDGKVGIGTQDPQAQLDVNGNIQTAGSLSTTQGITTQGDITLAGKIDLLSGSSIVKTIRPYDGLWGNWYSWTYCDAGTYVCGAQIRFEEYNSDGGDDTAMNAIRLACCSLGAEGTFPPIPPTSTPVP